MKSVKTLVVAVAVMMLALTSFIAIETTEDSDAFQGSPCNCSKMTTNFYIYADAGYTLPVTTLTGEGSNAYLALVDSIITYNSTYSTSYSVSASDKPYVRSGQYYMMNENYGNVTGLFGLSDDAASWIEYYWDGSSWALCGKGLGYYKSVSDVPADYKTSNIALVYTSGTTVPTATPTNSILNVSQCKEFAVSFYIDTTGTGVTSPGWITGYGSDCFKAFQNAIATNNLTSSTDNMNTTYDNQYYGYVDEFLGLDEYYNAQTNTYTSWSTFDYVNNQWVSSNFTLGHYTPGTDTYVHSTNDGLTMQTQYVILKYGAWTSTPPAISGNFPSHSC